LNPVEKAKEGVVHTASSIHKEGLVFETWGNVSCRPTDDRIVITPSGIPYEQLRFVDMVVVNMTGEVEEGRWKPSTELPLHRAVYEARTDIRAIVHTHSICATAFAVSRQDIPAVVEDQAQVIGGPVKIVEYAQCGSEELALNTVKALGQEGLAVLLANHGVLAVGSDLPSALQRCRIIERNAQIVLWSRLLGPPFVLDPEEIARLRNSFLNNYGQKNGL
jgi:L-fuculose-phosphate aldolase